MQRIPGYEILREIASGASGTVYEARQASLERSVALKVLSPGLFDAKETRARFLREARLQANLSHPNLLALYDAGFVGDVPYMAVELVTGGSLRDLLEGSGKLAVDETLRLCLEVADGLAVAHAAGVIHRDLKPENVLLTPEAQAKVADFGLAKAEDAAGTLQTSSGVILGTPGYMAPEVIQGQSAGPAADVYALGVMLYEMLAGRRPFGGEDLGEVMRAQLHGAFARLEELRPDVPAALGGVTALCLSLDPEARPAGAAEVARRLRLVPGAGEHARSGRVATARAAAASSPQVRVATRRGTGRHPVVRTAASGGQPVPPGTRVTVPMETPPRSPWPVLGALLLVGSLGAWTAWSFLAAPSEIPPLAVGTSVTVAGAPASPPPDLEGAADRPPAADPAVIPELEPYPRGLKSARLLLATPAPRGLRLELSSGRTFLIAEGDREVHLPNLTAGTSLEGVLRTDVASRPLRVETLRSLTGSPGVAVLPFFDGVFSSVSVGMNGDYMAVLGTDEPDSDRVRQHFTESRDGGTTWSPGESLEAEPKTRDDETLTMVAGHPLLGWLEGADERTDPRGVFHVRDVAKGAWRALPQVPMQRLGPLPVAMPDGTLSIFHMPPGARLAHCSRLQSLGPLPSTSQPVFEMTGQPRNWHSLVLRDRLLVFVQENPGGIPSTYFVAHAPLPGDRGWTPLAPVTDPREDGHSLSAAAVGNTVVIAYRAEKRGIRVRVSRDRGEHFSEAITVVEGDRHPKTASLIAAGGRFYLAFLARKFAAGEVKGWDPDSLHRESRINLFYQTSLDGESWTEVVAPTFLDILDSGSMQLVERSGELLAFIPVKSEGVLMVDGPSVGP